MERRDTVALITATLIKDIRADAHCLKLAVDKAQEIYELSDLKVNSGWPLHTRVHSAYCSYCRLRILLMESKIEELAMPENITTRFTKHGYRTIGELLSMTEEGAQSLGKLTDKYLEYLKLYLGEMGLSFRKEEKHGKEIQRGRKAAGRRSHRESLKQ